MRATIGLILLLALVLPLAARAQSVNEREAGVTTAANPSVEGVPPVSARRTLVVGVKVFERERVISTADGQAQLLFRDGSNFTIGPGSDMVLDDFVYDPGTGQGKIAASLGKGLFRFVGGALSKDGSVTLTTPTAVLAVRGGIALIQVSDTGATMAALLHGTELSVTSRTGETTSVLRPGFAVMVPNAQSAPSEPARLSPDQLRQGFDALRGQPDRAGGLAQRPSGGTVMAELRAPIATGTMGRPDAAGGPGSRPGATPAAMPSPFVGSGPPALQGPGTGQGPGAGGPPGMGGRPAAMGPGGPGGQAGPPAPGAAQARQRQMFAPNAPP